jgi:osmoprotectant transport system substrate-binding protein
VVREDVLGKHPAIADIIEPVTEQLTDETLSELNAEVDVEGRDPVEVAQGWLEKEGFIG